MDISVMLGWRKNSVLNLASHSTNGGLIKNYVLKIQRQQISVIQYLEPDIDLWLIFAEPRII